MATPGPGVMGTGTAGAPDGNWRAPQFRQKVVAQINDALRDACNPIEKSGAELENHIFNRAKDRDSYLSLVARLILHMRDSNAAKEKGLTGRMTPNMAGQQPDPMLALQGLTQMGQSQSPGLQMQPNPGQMVPGVGNQGNRPMMRSQIGQPQGGMSMDQHQQQVAQKLQKLMSTANSQPGAMPGTSMPQGVPQPVPQSQPSQMPHYQGGAAAAGMQPGSFQGPGGGGASMTPQPQPGMPGGPPPQGGPQMRMSPSQMAMQQPGMMPQQMQGMPRGPPNFQNQIVMQAQNPQTQMPPRPQVARTFSGQPTPPPQPVVTDSPAYRQQQSPAQPNQQVPTPGSNPLHSPASYLQASPSPQGHSIPSPASGSSQRCGPPSVPSPSSALNTPGNPSSVASANPSPGVGMRGGPGSNQGQAELIAYQEKMRQLSKYIEPLKKVIQINANREDGGVNPSDLNKMKGLLDILNNPNPKRLSLQQLSRCEQYLEGFEQQLKLGMSSSAPATATTTATTIVSSSSTGSTSTATTDSRSAGKSGNMFHPLLEVVRAHINSPSLNHSLQRTFGPALATLQGTPSHFPSPPAKKLKTEHDPSPTTHPAVPNIIQGEVARLSPKFHVNLDPMFHTSGKDVHLVCRLDDKNLPSVPPINISIPEQYPDMSPSCDVSAHEYGQTPFLKFVQMALQNQLMRLPDRFTLTQVLDAWEMSIRKSCLTMIAAREAI